MEGVAAACVLMLSLTVSVGLARVTLNEVVRVAVQNRSRHRDTSPSQ
jgi:hypothetical protein